MDQKDREILNILERDGRASFTDIADKVEVSEGTVRNRIEKMKEDGIIEKFTVKRGSASRAVVMVELDTDQDIQEILSGFPSGLEVMEVTGDKDLIVELSEERPEDINDMLDGIRNVEGVRSTKTFTILDQNCI